MGADNVGVPAYSGTGGPSTLAAGSQALSKDVGNMAKFRSGAVQRR